MKALGSTRLVKRSAVMLATVAATLVVAPTAAHARPTGCSTKLETWYAWSYCATGTGYHAITVYCNPIVGANYEVKGPKKRPGEYSMAWCKRTQDDADSYIVGYFN